MPREINRAQLLLALGLLIAASVSKAAERPRTLASIWLNSRGEAVHAGRTYRLVDEHGMAYILTRKAALEIRQ